MTDDSRRKKPRQARSKATVDAIVEATGQVFTDGGFRRTSTTRVAERAGVSVGSLYQYFPDKKALIAAFFERRLEQEAVWAERIAARDDLRASPRALITGATEEMLRLYREDRALYRGVVEALPLMEQTPEVQAGLARMVGLIAMSLASFPDMLRGRDPELLATMVFHGLRGAMNAVLARAPDKLDDPHLLDVLVGGALGMLGIDDLA
ncbi:MAG: TetR/AcrR family transcriptional regulator [Sandaracinaceae bacterium]